ncbi:MAG: diaminopimelate epimerase [Proteobacteria bacterium]|nr:diaminopimelate epimerase [Pseudomonadota bacterium]
MMYPFYKMQGLGNDFAIFLNNPDFKDPLFDFKSFTTFVADRRFGIGCDQIIFVDQETHFIRFFNADGSEAESCGNGTRCAADLLLKLEHKEEVTLDSKGGTLVCKRVNNLISVILKKPIIKGDIPLFPEDVFLKSGVFVDVGNPHLVLLDPLDDFLNFGPELENHPYFPNRTNVGFANVKDANTIDLKVWERGSGLTKACGSGACAAAIAAYEKGFCESTILVQQSGGNLVIEIGEDTITKIGPSELIFEGKLMKTLDV